MCHILVDSASHSPQTFKHTQPTHRLHQADLQPQELVHLAHPLGVAAGQVVVHRHHVHALACAVRSECVG